MKKHVVFAYSIISVLLYSNVSLAEKAIIMENFYIQENKTIKGGGSLSLGYRSLSADNIIKNTRFEQEFSHSNFKYEENLFEKAEVKSNLYYDIQKYDTCTPYIGVAAVVTRFSGADEYYADTVTEYNVMAGISYKPKNQKIVGVNMKYNYSDKLGDNYNEESIFAQQSGYINSSNHSIAAYLDIGF